MPPFGRRKAQVITRPVVEALSIIQIWNLRRHMRQKVRKICRQGPSHEHAPARELVTAEISKGQKRVREAAPEPLRRFILRRTEYDFHLLLHSISHGCRGEIEITTL